MFEKCDGVWTKIHGIKKSSHTYSKGPFTWRWGPQVGVVTRLGGVTRLFI